MEHTKKCRELICPDCDNENIFSSKEELKKHKVQVHDRIQCKDCDKVVAKKHLRRHKEAMHQNKGLKKFKCLFCDFTSHTKKNVNYHTNHVHFKKDKLDKRIKSS